MERFGATRDGVVKIVLPDELSCADYYFDEVDMR
jgi:hypothetical protein